MTEVKTIMSKNLKTVCKGSTLQDAYTIMEEFRIRHLPVVDFMGEIMGIVTYKDLHADYAVLKMPVEFFMSFPVEQISENSSLRSTALRMLEKKLSSLLIINEDQEVVGIVTTDDLLWHLASHFKNENDEAPFMDKVKLQTTIGEIARMFSQAGI